MALLEYAFVLIVFLTVLFGIIDFGRAMYTYHFVSNAARDGTRFAIVRGSTCPPGTISYCPAGEFDYRDYLRSQMTGIGLDPNAVSADTKWPPVANNPPICATIFNNPGCIVQVQVSYAFKFIFPFMPANFTMQSTSQMVISQ
ncbi:MAG: TadE family protein [Candidatus Acidiferrales bacterium]